jgi:hypothetical protein
VKSSEEAIEKVFAGLRDSEVPAGMERRILRAVEAHSSSRSRAGWDWRRLRSIWMVTSAFPGATRALVCGAALAGVFVVGLVLPGIHRLANAPVRLNTSSASAALISPTASGGVQLSSADKSSLRLRVKVNTHRAGLVRESDSVAVREMRAASLPAPPLPLTEQEKLLLRVAHKGDPEQLAMLIPEVRAKREAEGDAEFEKFFGRSETAGNE